MALTAAAMNQQRYNFFRLAFGEGNTGYICLSWAAPNKRSMHEEFFKYPEELPQLVDTVARVYVAHNVWYCPQLLSAKRRIKENVVKCPSAWADLDTCPPDLMLVPPSVVVQSSPQRYQALWLFDEAVEPLTAMDISRRIAYYHSGEGADKSGYDLTQLLRVPYTYNKKYLDDTEVPMVTVVQASHLLYRPGDFDEYPNADPREYSSMPYPELEDLEGLNPEVILEKYRRRLHPSVYQLHQVRPEDEELGPEGWSGAFWRLLLNCFEAGMEPLEVFEVGRTAACNKHARDGKPDTYVWEDVCRAMAKHEQNLSIIVPKTDEVMDLLTEDEMTRVQEAGPTFIDRYITWASSVGDAAVQYHQAGAFMALSSILAGSVVLPTSFGVVIPNLWFMLLADTTLTRKSTSMDMSMDMVAELDEDVILATDGSIEGLMSAISVRPNKPSVFVRDEFSGLLDQMTKKDYMAGMMEWFTKLYDGKNDKRQLRKETISIRNPIFLMYVGGIRNRITQLLTPEHVMSGFLPRFIFITATSDPSRVKPLGPPTTTSTGGRDKIINELQQIYSRFSGMTEVSSPNGLKMMSPRKWDAELTPAAWLRYNKFEEDMMESGIQAENADMMTPMYIRLGTSGLKAAVLLAAAEGDGQSKIIVDEIHILRAIKYVEVWRAYAIEVVNSVGRGATENLLQRIVDYVTKNSGTTRGKVMQQFHLTAREADNVFNTLEQRQLIRTVRSGKATLLFPTVVSIRFPVN